MSVTIAISKLNYKTRDWGSYFSPLVKRRMSRASFGSCQKDQVIIANSLKFYFVVAISEDLLL